MTCFWNGWTMGWNEYGGLMRDERERQKKAAWRLQFRYWLVPALFPINFMIGLQLVQHSEIRKGIQCTSWTKWINCIMHSTAPESKLLSQIRMSVFVSMNKFFLFFYFFSEKKTSSRVDNVKWNVVKKRTHDFLMTDKGGWTNSSYNSRIYLV